MAALGMNGNGQDRLIVRHPDSCWLMQQGRDGKPEKVMRFVMKDGRPYPLEQAIPAAQLCLIFAARNDINFRAELEKIGLKIELA